MNVVVILHNMIIVDEHCQDLDYSLYEFIGKQVRKNFTFMILEGKAAAFFKFTIKFYMWILTQIFKEISWSGGRGMGNKATSMFHIIYDKLCVMCDEYVC